MQKPNDIPEDLNYRYYAFISYSRKDKKWVDWLHKSIEHYSIPEDLRNEYSTLDRPLPKFVRPIFRDTTDITPKGGLALTLKQEMEQSKYLIVICSPSSAKPNADGTHWVNDEIIEFQNMGRNNRIIPFIVEGNPESQDPAVQCYPPALRDLDDKHLGINIHENANHTSFMRKILRAVGLDRASNNAVLKVLAVLLNLYYDDLKRRHQSRAQQKNIFATLVLLCVMFVSFWIYDENYRIKTHYYTDYIIRYGVPEGIFPLSIDAMQAKNDHYRLIYQGGKLLEFRYVDSYNKLLKHPTGFSQSPSKVLFSDYDKNNRPRSMQYYDEKNHEAMFLSWTADRKAVDFKINESEDSASPKALSASMLAQRDIEDDSKKSSIIRYKFEYDDEGYAKKQWFMASTYEDSNLSDIHNIFGYSFVRDDNNVIIKQSFLNLDGSVMSVKNGTSSVGYEYDENCWLISISFLDKNDKLVLQDDNYAKIIKKYNEKGNVIEEVFLGKNGEPIVYADGYAKTRQKFDENGNIIEKAYLGVNDEPVLYHGVATLKQKFDDRGNMVEQAYLGTNGEPILNNDGFAKLTQKFDNYGNISEQRFFGINNEPILNNHDVAILTQKFDENGYKIAEAYFGINSEPILSSNGIAKITEIFNEDTSTAEQEYFGVSDEPVLYNGYAKFTQKLDDRGNVIEQAYFGTRGEPILSNDGIAKLTHKFDRRGRETEEAYFGVNNEPILSKGGYVKIKREFDSKGNLIKETFLGPQNEPVLAKAGYVRPTQMLDKARKKNEVAPFHAHDEPALGEYGFAQAAQKRGERGYVVEKNTFGSTDHILLDE